MVRNSQNMVGDGTFPDRWGMAKHGLFEAGDGAVR